LFGKGLLKGMRITLKRMLGPTVTESYPDEMPDIHPNVCSSLDLDPDTCIVCNLCALVCPNEVITIKGKRGEDGKKVLTSYVMDMGRCLFCGYCVEACPTDALKLSQQFENAIYDADGLIWDMIARAKEREKEGA